MSLTLAFGSKDNVMEDIHLLAKQGETNPKIVVVTGPGAGETLLEKTSALFLDEHLVLVLLDPTESFVEEMKGTLSILKEKMNVIIYCTSSDFDLPASLGAVKITLEKEKEKRFREKVRSVMKMDGKKMTEKALALLQERVKDEALLEEELAKLMSYTGDKKLIELRDVAAIVTEVHDGDFIALSEAIARKSKKEVIAILETLLSQETNILAVHGFMARHIRLLLQAKDAGEFLQADADFRSFSKGFAGLKEKLDLTPMEKRHYLAYQKPYYAYNLTKTSKKFTKQMLVSFLHMLAGFDLKVKKGTKHDRTNFEAGLLGV